MPENLTALSCGVFIMRRKGAAAEFLLMRHADRLDFPKGHVEEGETELQCALRELEEETGISADQVSLDPVFRYTVSYEARYKRFNYQLVTKTLVLFLGWIAEGIEPQVTEHAGFEWHPWNPPHAIQEQAIDPFLSYLEKYIHSCRDLHQS